MKVTGILAWMMVLASVGVVEGLTIEQVLLEGNYKLLNSNKDDITRALRVTRDGRVSWQTGFPTVYSIFREQVVKSNETEVRSYTLEAVATQRWICMKPNGRIYTVRQPVYNQNFRIRHELSKRRRKKRLLQFIGSPQRPPPPINCLFRTFTFPDATSYERNIAIYSVSHGNATHSRFLATSPRHETRVRSYRKSFQRLHTNWAVRTSQDPLKHTHKIISASRFGGGPQSDLRVRGCLKKLLGCEVVPSWGRRNGRGNLILKLIKGCRQMGRLRTEPECPKGLEMPFGGKKRSKNE